MALDYITGIGRERIRAGLSMTEVAEGAGLSQQMVSYIERGMRKPTVDTLWRITDVLGLDLWRVLRTVEKDASSQG